MWYSKFLCICALITFINGNDEKPKKTIEPKLKFVFITVREPAHWPCDFPNGPTIFGRSEFTSRLSWRGRNDAYDYGVEIGEMYKEKFGIEKWTKNKYGSYASGSPRTQQAALILAAGLENKRYKRDRIWSIEKKNSTQFPAMKEYIKFYIKKQCPRFLQQVKINYPKQNYDTAELIKAIAILKKKFIPKKTSIEIPEDIWIAYESLYNVFYSYRKTYNNKMKYWKQIRNELKKYTKQFMWSSLTADQTLRKLASGPIVFDVLRDIKYIRGNHSTNDKQAPKKNELAPKNNERVLSILTVPQGVFAALVTGFAPNGTRVDGKLFGADDLYPEHGAMHIIELYHVKNDKWQVKILYRRKKEDCLKPLRLPECNENEKLLSNLCKLKHLKEAVNGTSLGPKSHDTLCMELLE